MYAGFCSGSKTQKRSLQSNEGLCLFAPHPRIKALTRSRPSLILGDTIAATSLLRCPITAAAVHPDTTMALGSILFAGSQGMKAHQPALMTCLGVYSRQRWIRNTILQGTRCSLKGYPDSNQHNTVRHGLHGTHQVRVLRFPVTVPLQRPVKQRQLDAPVMITSFWPGGRTSDPDEWEMAACCIRTDPDRNGNLFGKQPSHRNITFAITISLARSGVGMRARFSLLSPVVDSAGSTTGTRHTNRVL